MLNKLQAMRKNMKKKNKGFTLVELIVVIVIIAIIAAVAIPRIVTFQESARKTRINSEHRQLVTAIQSFLAQGTNPKERADEIENINSLTEYMNIGNAQAGDDLESQLAKDGDGLAHEIKGGVLTSKFTTTNDAIPSQTWTYNFK